MAEFIRGALIDIDTENQGSVLYYFKQYKTGLIFFSQNVVFETGFNVSNTSQPRRPKAGYVGSFEVQKCCEMLLERTT